MSADRKPVRPGSLLVDPHHEVWTVVSVVGGVVTLALIKYERGSAGTLLSHGEIPHYRCEITTTTDPCGPAGWELVTLGWINRAKREMAAT